ncbi:MAG: hypothetical protein WA431_08865 [Candidatus Cybelea sp.]
MDLNLVPQWYSGWLVNVLENKQRDDDLIAGLDEALRANLRMSAVIERSLETMESDALGDRQDLLEDLRKGKARCGETAQTLEKIIQELQSFA